MRPFVAAVVAIFTLLFLMQAVAVLADTTGLVRGTALFQGKPATGIAVTLSGEGTTLRVSTDAAGAFVFSRVAFGRYTLSAHRDGSPDHRQPVDVESNAVVNLTFEMQLKEIGRTQTAFTKGPGASPVSVNSIGREQLASLPENQSLNNVITTFPGIARFSYNEPIAHGFHGLSYELDGVPLPQGTTSNFSEIVDPRTIDSLEVFSGRVSGGVWRVAAGGCRQHSKPPRERPHYSGKREPHRRRWLLCGRPKLAFRVNSLRNHPRFPQRSRADRARDRFANLRSSSR